MSRPSFNFRRASLGLAVLLVLGVSAPAHAGWEDHANWEDHWSYAENSFWSLLAVYDQANVRVGAAALWFSDGNAAATFSGHEPLTPERQSIERGPGGMVLLCIERCSFHRLTEAHLSRTQGNSGALQADSQIGRIDLSWAAPPPTAGIEPVPVKQRFCARGALSYDLRIDVSMKGIHLDAEDFLSSDGLSDIDPVGTLGAYRLALPAPGMRCAMLIRDHWVTSEVTWRDSPQA